MDANLCKLSIAREAIYADESIVRASGTYTITGLPVAGQTVTIGTKVYTFKPNIAALLADGDVLIGASAAACATNLIDAINANPDKFGITIPTTTTPHTRVFAQTGGSGIVTALAIFPGIPPGLVAAAITLTGDTVIVTANDTVTIDGKIYTFKAAVAAEGDVKIAGTAALTLTNLFEAINKSGGNPGVDYLVAAAHPTVIATNPTATTVVITARTAGTPGNAITTTEASTHLAFGGGVLAGGTDNTIATTDTCANGSWGAATLTGGAGIAPTFQELRFTGEGIVPGKQTVVSAEIRSDRSISDLIQVGLDSKGPTNHELHCVGLDELILAALLAGEWQEQTIVDATCIVVGQTVSMPADTNAMLLGARYIQISGLQADARNNGTKKVLSNNGVDTFTLAPGSFFADEDHAANVTCRYARNGVSLQTYKLLKEFLSLAPHQSSLAIGMVLNQLDLSLDSKAIAKITANWMGAKQVSSPGSFGKQAPTAPTSKPILNTTSNVGSILYNGVASLDPIMKMNLSIANNLGERPQIGSLISALPRKGSCEIKGQITTYFKTRALFEDFLAHSMRSLEFPLIDSLGGLINLYMPQVRFANASNLIGGINTDISLPLDFQAVLGTASYMLQVDNLPV